MARLGAREREAIETAKQQGPEGPFARPDRVELYLDARRLQSEAMARMTAHGIAGVVRLARDHGVGPLVRWQRRRRTASELSRLDDRALADIGVERANIAAVAARLAGTPAGARRGAARGDGLLARMRARRQRRTSIEELRRLDDRTLADIGLHRSQVVGVVDGLLTPRRGSPHGPMGDGSGRTPAQPAARRTGDEGGKAHVAPKRRLDREEARWFRGDAGWVVAVLSDGALPSRPANRDKRRHVA